MARVLRGRTRRRAGLQNRVLINSAIESLLRKNKKISAPAIERQLAAQGKNAPCQATIRAHMRALGWLPSRK